MLTFIQLMILPLWTSTSSADAEKLFHNRDHSDIETLTSHHAEVITDKFTAELFLSRYGFIKPVNWEEIQFEDSDISFNDDFLDNLQDMIQEGTSVHHSRDALQDGDYDDHNSLTKSLAFISALKEFQRVSGLPATGVFDAATKVAMNKPRCGVPDKEIDLDAPVAPENSGALDLKTVPITL
ncbi:Matrix metalloproteinase-21 [Dissostichus eleginoides]|uniref:Matrix metalloproteinase-21 n=1 Tax=Dissostichus eleginoides TaxID=100907 RepID=A0AAD9F157_DISEL|nr:Matrix metalloproteinase-21 [Dissostichus eleginoides]